MAPGPVGRTTARARPSNVVQRGVGEALLGRRVRARRGPAARRARRAPPATRRSALVRPCRRRRRGRSSTNARSVRRRAISLRSARDVEQHRAGRGAQARAADLLRRRVSATASSSPGSYVVSNSARKRCSAPAGCRPSERPFEQQLHLVGVGVDLDPHRLALEAGPASSSTTTSLHDHGLECATAWPWCSGRCTAMYGRSRRPEDDLAVVRLRDAGGR